ncbi:MAG: hypothetical protein ACM37W_20905 [Actinomycetota bacterium]
MDTYHPDTLYSANDPPSRNGKHPAIQQELEGEIAHKMQGNPKVEVSKNRLKTGLLLLGALMAGIAISNGQQIKEHFIKPIPQPEAESSPTPEASPSPKSSPIFADEFNSDKQIRDAYIDKSFEAIDTQRGRIDETAADGVLNDARAENKSKGTPYEVYLMRRINRAIAEGRLLVGQGVDLTSPEGIRKGWIWLGEAKGLLIAWKRIIDLNSELLTEGKITPQVTGTANLAAVLAQMVVAVERGAIVRSGEFEQVLRNQFQAEQERKKQEELLRLQKQAEEAKKKGGKGNGKQ